MTLEFQGTGADNLLAVLLAGISVILCAWGLRQLIVGRFRVGLVSLAAGAIGALVTLGVAFCIIEIIEKNSGAFWLGLLTVQLTVAVGVLYSAVYTYLGPRRLGALMGLRVAAILALLLILFKPVMLIPADLTGLRPALPILVDRSGSMATADEADLPDRYSQAVQMLRAQAKRIGQHFRPVWISFAAKPERNDSLCDLRDLQPSGKGTSATNIASAIIAAGNSASRADLAGVVLISDGINNAPGNPTRQAAKLGAPIYALAVGAAGGDRTGGRANFQLLSVEAPVVAAVNNVTQIVVRVRITHLPNASCEVRLYEGQGTTPVATEQIWTAANDATVTARLNWTPRVEGSELDKTSQAANVRKLRLQVVANNLEVNRDDNTAELHVLLRNPKIRVLYIEGTIRPEYKYLRRMLQTDPNVQFVGLIRIAENRFWSQGSIGGRKLLAMPGSDEDFGMFDVIILGDLDSSFLSLDQQARLRAFVSAGGGLLMIGGRNSFGPGGYAKTAVALALPVEVGPRSTGQEMGAFLPRLTAAGEAHPIFAGIAGYFPGPKGREPDPQLSKLPALRGCVRIVRAKPAAAILALHSSSSSAVGPMVVLAVEQYGAGRSAAFAADTTWLWYLPMRLMGSQSPYHRFWGQMVRWLAGADMKNRQAGSAAILRLSRSYGRAGGQDIKFSALVHNPAGQPANDARLVCEVHPSDGSDKKPSDGSDKNPPDGNDKNPGQTVQLSAGVSPGTYSGRFEPSRPGDFVVKLTATDATGNKLGQDELPLKIAPQSTELENLSRNDELLREIAKTSGGLFAELTALPDLLDNIIARQQRIAGPPPLPTIRRLYNFPILFVLFAGLLTVEWLLRRTWQMH